MIERYTIGLWVDKFIDRPYPLIRMLNETNISVLMHSDFESALSTFSTSRKIDFVVCNIEINDALGRSAADFLQIVPKEIPRILYGSEYEVDRPDGVIYFHSSEAPDMLDYILNLSS